MTKQPVLIVEDTLDWQEILNELIVDAGFEPHVVGSYIEAVTALDNSHYALVVVDMSLAHQDYNDRGGIKVLESLLERPDYPPAIVVTGYGTIELAIETLAELDARHFFRKEEFDRQKFIEAVQQITGPAGPMMLLSEREREVLLLMSQGLTNKQIAVELTVSVNTVKKHIQNIFTKLNVDSRAAAVAQALG